MIKWPLVVKRELSSARQGEELRQQVEPLLLHVERGQLREFRHLVRMPPGFWGRCFRHVPVADKGHAEEIISLGLHTKESLGVPSGGVGGKDHAQNVFSATKTSDKKSNITKGSLSLSRRVLSFQLQKHHLLFASTYVQCSAFTSSLASGTHFVSCRVPAILSL